MPAGRDEVFLKYRRGHSRRGLIVVPIGILPRAGTPGGSDRPVLSDPALNAGRLVGAIEELTSGRRLMYSLNRQEGDTVQASIVDLRYKMKQVLKALERNETVSVLYRGKLKGVLSPATTTSAAKVTEHNFFGCRKDAQSVQEVMEQLRGGRHRDL